MLASPDAQPAPARPAAAAPALPRPPAAARPGRAGAGGAPLHRAARPGDGPRVRRALRGTGTGGPPRARHERTYAGHRAGQYRALPALVRQPPPGDGRAVHRGAAGGTGTVAAGAGGALPVAAADCRARPAGSGAGGGQRRSIAAGGAHA
ncbi:hypothetical protein G6F59_014394 [Rhizopus arrhizus]|nr:hypothetical protein G6F59_014394 [Rhizopus arrhizus]